MKTEVAKRAPWGPRFLVAVAALTTARGAGALQTEGSDGKLPMPVPVFQVDPGWPQKLPYNWIVGHVASVAVDSRNHVLVLQRPNTIPPEDRARAAPPVIEFDAAGNFVTAWGGPAPDTTGPTASTELAIDDRNNVRIGGKSPVAPSLRNPYQRYAAEVQSAGSFLKIGGRDKRRQQNRRASHQSTRVVMAEQNEAFAPRYGNRRTHRIVTPTLEPNSDMWGAFLGTSRLITRATPLGRLRRGRVLAGGRAWNATCRWRARCRPAAPAGQPRTRTRPAAGHRRSGARGSREPKNAQRRKVSNDGLVYVADHRIGRLQVFTPTESPEFTQMFLDRAVRRQARLAGVAFSPDPQQKFL